MARQRLGHRVQHELEVGLDVQPVAQRDRRMDDRQYRAAALLAGADGDLSPMGQALVGALIVEANLASLADQRVISLTPSSVAFWIAQSMRSPRDRP